MQLKSFWYFILLLGVSTFSCKSSSELISRKDARSAENLIGLNLSPAGVDTMLPYLERNKRGYDSLRHYDIGINVQPPLYFDPRPIGFEIPDWQDAIVVLIDDNTDFPKDSIDLAFMPVTKLASLIKNRKISSLELTKFFLRRLKQHNEQLECVINFTEDYAISRAKIADELLAADTYLGPLHGIPYGIKDLFSFKNYPTTWGSAPYKNQMIDETATVIEKLEEAGAVLIAKLVSGALARGDVWFGGKTKNPWDLKQGASGSSAGSGSAMAAGLCAFTIGTETLGSIVSPANRNGVTGLRPTYGRVSKSGVMSLSWTMDKVGPLCRSAEDCTIVLQAIHGFDSDDPSTTQVPLKLNPKPINQYKIGYIKSAFARDTTDRAPVAEKALNVFRELGFQLDSIALPKDIPYDGFDVILRAEAGAFFDELVRSGKVDGMVEQGSRSRANSLRQSRFIPAVEYIQANRHRNILIQQFHEIISQYDAIISPTFGGRQLLLTNLTGHPSICIPTGLDEKDHPTSITLIGNLYDESSIINLAKLYQESTNHDELRPPLFNK